MVGRSGKHKNVIVLFPVPLAPLSKKRLKTEKPNIVLTYTCQYSPQPRMLDRRASTTVESVGAIRIIVGNRYLNYMINLKFLLRELFILKSSPHLYSLHTHIHTCMHTYTHTHIHTYTHTYMHAYTHIHTHILVHAYINTHTHTHTCIHTYTHIHTHTYLHTYTNTQTHTLFFNPAWFNDPTINALHIQICSNQRYVTGNKMNHSFI